MEILKSGPIPLPKEITREKIREKFGLTQRELYLLMGDDPLISNTRLFMLDSFDTISPDERCRKLTGGLPVRKLACRPLRPDGRGHSCF